MGDVDRYDNGTQKQLSSAMRRTMDEGNPLFMQQAHSGRHRALPLVIDKMVGTRAV